MREQYSATMHVMLAAVRKAARGMIRGLNCIARELLQARPGRRVPNAEGTAPLMHATL